MEFHPLMTQPTQGRRRASSRRAQRPAPRSSTSRTSSGAGQLSEIGSDNGSNRNGRPRNDRSAAGRRSRPRRRGRSASQPSAAASAGATPTASVLDDALDAALRRPCPPVLTFTQLGLPARLVTALERQGIRETFAIQARALPDALAGRDVLGRAQTGSGKTLAFGLPALARLAAGPSSGAPRAPRALVLAPTRELARQVSAVLSPLAQAVGLKVASVIGGAPYGRQIDVLTKGIDVLVATPGRLIDLIERGACYLDRVEITVLDEADYMADLGFLPAVTRILRMTPDGGQRLLFSATLDRGVTRLVQEFLTDPVVHAVAPAAATATATTHRVFTLDCDSKAKVAAEVAARPARTLFFVRTKRGVDRLAKQLGRAGVEAAAIHGNLGQGARQRALAAFAAGRVRVLVATDVAARGIHVDDVDLVVHYDPPNDHKDYLHRSGRTARAGAEGTVIVLAQAEEVPALRQLHSAAQVVATLEAVHPGHPAVRAVATSGEPVVVRAPAQVRPPRGGRDRPPRSDRGRVSRPNRSRRPPHPS